MIVLEYPSSMYGSLVSERDVLVEQKVSARRFKRAIVDPCRIDAAEERGSAVEKQGAVRSTRVIY